MLSLAAQSWSETWNAFVVAPWERVDWQSLAFWGQLLDDRLLVVAILPLLPLLWLTPARHLPTAICVAGLVLLGGLFGAFYLVIWVLGCLLLYAYSEWFAREVRRTDILPLGPPLAAWIILGGIYFGSFFWFKFNFGTETNTWLVQHAPWLFPGWIGYYFAPTDVQEQFRQGASQAGVFINFTFFGAHLIGTAYLAVRMLHYLTDIRRGELPDEQRSLKRFLTYLWYPPTVMQGPIERHQRFHDQIEKCVDRRTLRSTLLGLARIGWGLTKAAISTIWFIPVIAEYLSPPESLYYSRPQEIESYLFLYLGVYINIFWLYLEFSAYCDIAVGFSWILGYRLIENFNMPWIATSMRDFWRRWHISLSGILRDYIYIPLGGNRNRNTFNLCVTFALVGIWHGPFPQLAVWGVIMGLIVATNQAWYQWHKRTADAQTGLAVTLRKLGHAGGPVTTVLSWWLTMHCFCHSLLVFFGGWEGLLRVTWELIRRPLGLPLGGV